jgi:hypothetical protein
MGNRIPATMAAAMKYVSFPYVRFAIFSRLFVTRCKHAAFFLRVRKIIAENGCQLGACVSVRPCAASWLDLDGCLCNFVLRGGSGVGGWGVLLNLLTHTHTHTHIHTHTHTHINTPTYTHRHTWLISLYF